MSAVFAKNIKYDHVWQICNTFSKVTTHKFQIRKIQIKQILDKCLPHWLQNSSTSSDLSLHSLKPSQTSHGRTHLFQTKSKCISKKWSWYFIERIQINFTCLFQTNENTFDHHYTWKSFFLFCCNPNFCKQKYLHLTHLHKNFWIWCTRYRRRYYLYTYFNEIKQSSIFTFGSYFVSQPHYNVPIYK